MQLEINKPANSIPVMVGDSNELTEFEDENIDMGSLNHSLAQTQIVRQLLNDERFTTIVELSLDIGQIDLTQFGLDIKRELKPDICLYPKGKVQPDWTCDVLKMPDMPLLVIEVLSPRQGMDEILRKIRAYFALGIQSCWMVVPTTESITVYSKPREFISFSMKDTEVIDEVMDIRLSIKKIFNL
ncbi:Uma2 family endonuclease [Candidatus Parabeggiatoa sp. HSG14]|uniref:Uma2 family endonuclease n=1 Tax=Candidatus Parabeggiatoa sp. HSG14 TaxID=3055593 RepID=UPI0025A81D0E|nr:Uma2 family endonuclease [Thiotrichales bacterium HSG14]